MFTRIALVVAGLLSFSLPLSSLAGGSVSFSQDVLPLLRDNPDLINPVLTLLEITEIGDATRIGRAVCPGLGGTRVSPYVFTAKVRGSASGRAVLTINSNIDFFDRNGRLVFHIEDGVPAAADSNFDQAVSLRETFSSLNIRMEKSAPEPRGTE